jgi:hypothetical protein
LGEGIRGTRKIENDYTRQLDGYNLEVQTSHLSRFQVIIAAIMNMAVFWVVALCIPPSSP